MPMIDLRSVNVYAGGAFVAALVSANAAMAQAEDTETGSLLGSGNLSAWSSSGGMAGELLPQQSLNGRDTRRTVYRPPSETCTFSTDAQCRQGVGAFVSGTLGGGTRSSGF
ncbi:MAG: hypothetical protein AAGF94_00170 [Pseudomonadota bacterium]